MTRDALHYAAALDVIGEHTRAQTAAGMVATSESVALSLALELAEARRGRCAGFVRAKPNVVRLAPKPRPVAL